MIAIARSASTDQRPLDWQERFLSLLPGVERYAKIAFRHLGREASEDAVEEVVANALVAFKGLHDCGKSNLAHPTVLARYAVGHFYAGRRAGGRLKATDVLAKHVRHAHNLTVERLDGFDSKTGDWIEAIVDDRRTPVPDQAAFRCDFPAWLATQRPRDRRAAELLAVGYAPSEIARRFHLSRGRVSQLRNELYDSWQQFHGESVPRNPRAPLVA